MEQEDDKELEDYYQAKERKWILGEKKYVDKVNEKYIHNQRYDREIPERRKIERERQVRYIEECIFT